MKGKAIVNAVTRIRRQEANNRGACGEPREDSIELEREKYGQCKRPSHMPNKGEPSRNGMETEGETKGSKETLKGAIGNEWET